MYKSQNKNQKMSEVSFFHLASSNGKNLLILRLDFFYLIAYNSEAV